MPHEQTTGCGIGRGLLPAGSSLTSIWPAPPENFRIMFNVVWCRVSHPVTDHTDEQSDACGQALELADPVGTARLCPPHHFLVGLPAAAPRADAGFDFAANAALAAAVFLACASMAALSWPRWASCITMMRYEHSNQCLLGVKRRTASMPC